MREQIMDLRLPFVKTMFENAEIFGTLKMFQHFLDVFKFANSGDGSWPDAMDRLQTLRGVGNGLQGEGLANHYLNVQKGFEALSSDLFDVVETFTQKREAPNVSKLISARVFEMGGKFDTYLGYINTQTSALNSLIALNPMFGRVINGGDQSAGGGGS